MMSACLCGTGSFPKEEDDDYERQTRSAESSPRKFRSKSSKNLYSNRGLDKFSALLAEIEEKRQQIYSQVDPDEISLVRFSYSGDHDFKPIVVKIKPKGEMDNKPKSDIDKVEHNSSSSSSMSVKEENKAENKNHKMKKKMGLFRKLRVYQWSEPKFYFPMIAMLILMLLVLFGRSFAIMCTSIGWYLIPTITNQGNSLNLRMSFKKKDYAMRRLSEKKLIKNHSTMSFKSSDAKSQQQNGNRKSI